MWCLIPQLADRFKQDIVSGVVNPDKLSNMTSAERRAFFTERFGEANAKEMNTIFESKLLLKNRQLAMINWAKRVMNYDKTAQRDIITKISKMDHVLTPSEEKAFLEDIASKRLGVDITYDEAKKIAELSSKVQSFTNKENNREYGRAVVALTNYVNDLKVKANSLSLADLRERPAKTTLEAVSRTAGFAKSIKASLDNSAIFRQGWKTLWTNPVIWKRNAADSFVNIAKTIGGKNVIDEVNADIVSRPNYLNGIYKRAKLAVGTIEEAYPETLPEKIPGLGRLYKASQDAYTGFVHKTRADVFDKYLEIAKKSKIPVDDKLLQGIGRLTNSLTGRGTLGRLEPSANVVNNVFFSPRFLKSQVDFLTAHAFDKTPSFVKKQAALNLLKVAMATAAILTTARAINKDSVEFDPRSSDFGKIRVGNTRFDVTGGMSSIITLVARMLPFVGGYKTSGGDVIKIGGTGFGAKQGKDVIWDFMENKFSPVASVINTLFIRKSTRSGEKPTVGSIASDLFAPLPITNYQELSKDPNSANKLLVLIADGSGIATNTYGNVSDIKPSQVYDAVSGSDIGNNLALVKSFARRGATKDDLTKLLDQYYSEHPVKSDSAKKQRAENKTNITKLLNSYSKLSEGTYTKSSDAPKDIFSTIGVYGKGVVKDPENTLKALFTEERLRKVVGDTAVLERKDFLGLLDEGDKSTQIDHKIALALGGDNSPSNLQVLSNDDNKVKGQLEVYLQKEVEAGRMTKKRAQEIDRKWKDNLYLINK